MAAFMLLPSKAFENSLLVALPADVAPHAAYRCAVSIIAQVETESDSASQQEIVQALEEHGFIVVDYVLGPELD